MTNCFSLQIYDKISGGLTKQASGFGGYRHQTTEVSSTVVISYYIPLYIYIGCSGLFVGHPFDTVKVCLNLI